MTTKEQLNEAITRMDDWFGRLDPFWIALKGCIRELIAENEQLEARNKRQHEALTIRTKFSDGYSNPDQAKLAQLENAVLHLTRALSELVGSRAVG